MPRCFDPKLDILPSAQMEIWAALRPAADFGFVLYGGTAIALQLGHRQSIDFDFFSSTPLDKLALAGAFPFIAGAKILQDEPETFVALAPMASGPVKISFFGGLRLGRVADPVQTRDGVLLVASLDDLMATKLKAILDRAELRDYRDLAAMIAAGASLPKALAAFRTMFHAEPRTALVAIGYFEDGNIGQLTRGEKSVLTGARDAVRTLPEVNIASHVLAIPRGPCDSISA